MQQQESPAAVHMIASPLRKHPSRMNEQTQTRTVHHNGLGTDMGQMMGQPPDEKAAYEHPGVCNFWSGCTGEGRQLKPKQIKAHQHRWEKKKWTEHLLVLSGPAETGLRAEPKEHMKPKPMDCARELPSFQICSCVATGKVDISIEYV
jgi:hypothetical protein